MKMRSKDFRAGEGDQINLRKWPTNVEPIYKSNKEYQKLLEEHIAKLSALQQLLYASNRYAVLLIFQALDAAGKDSTIEHVMSGVNPQGVSVYSFKAPTEEERLHHFLWRPMRVLPAAGTIAIFNRSYYEEVLVVRVHPEFLDGQLLTRERHKQDLSDLWQSRYDNINAFEKSLARENTRVLKFFLHVSREEQRQRFLKRLDDPEKNWKFSVADLKERSHWDEYQTAYQDMLRATSTEDAPWYIIPADKKWFMRACVADIISTELRGLGLEYPHVGEREAVALAEAKKQLEAEQG